MTDDPTKTTGAQAFSAAPGSVFFWQPIETAPKDGTIIVLWCQSAKEMLLDCSWDNKRGWTSWDIGGFDQMGYWKLEPYEVPTHWMLITPPNAQLSDGS